MSFHLISSVKLFVAQAAIQVYTVLDKTMIGMITNSELQNGYYEQAQKLVRILVAVSTSISAVMASRIAVLSSKKDSKAIEETVEFSFRFVSCISIPIIFGIVLVAQDFVPFFYGQGYRIVGNPERVASGDWMQQHHWYTVSGTYRSGKIPYNLSIDGFSSKCNT